VSTATLSQSLCRAGVRALNRDDLPAVVAIDAAIRGRSRAPYFERRLAAALREPALHAQLASIGDDGVNGFILARVLEGEFGRQASALRLEVVGVRPAVQRRGAGDALLAALAAWAARHRITELRTQALWNDHAMLRWLDHAGFALAPEHIVDCPVEAVLDAPAHEDDATIMHPAGELDYGAPGDTQVERLARDTADVRTMEPGDLAEIKRIDRRVTGRDRSEYIRHKLDEAMRDSGVRVSLTARLDGTIVGYLMARADYGDFGRPEPVAVLDTIGVEPGYTHRGVAHALLSQLGVNLAALQIERIETVVAPHDLALFGFLYDTGFRPSQRVPFVRRVAPPPA
jgi:ribosomal protein S18 acetylase RimI-like enzyme